MARTLTKKNETTAEDWVASIVIAIAKFFKSPNEFLARTAVIRRRIEKSQWSYVFLSVYLHIKNKGDFDEYMKNSGLQIVNSKDEYGGVNKVLTKALESTRNMEDLIRSNLKKKTPAQVAEYLIYDRLEEICKGDAGEMISKLESVMDQQQTVWGNAFFDKLFGVRTREDFEQLCTWNNFKPIGKNLWIEAKIAVREALADFPTVIKNIKKSAMAKKRRDAVINTRTTQKRINELIQEMEHNSAKKHKPDLR